MENSKISKILRILKDFQDLRIDKDSKHFQESHFHSIHFISYFSKTFDYTEESKPQIAAKLKSVLCSAAIHGHDSLVLSAWGCGAFKNPPFGQSKLWREILFDDKEFEGKFKKIVFAIFDDHNTGKPHNPMGNYLPFLERFGITKRRISEFVESMNQNEVDDDDEEKGNDDDDDNGGDTFDSLKAIFEGISENEKTRDLEYEAVRDQFGGNMAALNVLYCGGWKRSSDGARLQLERKRMQIANDVYQQLMQHEKEVNEVK